MSEITIVLTDAQLTSIAEQQDAGGGNAPPEYDEFSYEDLFGAEVGEGSGVHEASPISDPNRFQYHMVKINFSFRPADVGKTFQMSERVTGAGSKSCAVLKGDSIKSQKGNIGTGNMFSITVAEGMVNAPMVIYYWQNTPDSDFVSSIQAVLR